METTTNYCGKTITQGNAMTWLYRAKQALDEAQEDINVAVVLARQTGASWATIGKELGISKQAAQQRYGFLPETYPEALRPAPEAAEGRQDGDREQIDGE